MAEYYDPKTYLTQWNYLQSGTIVDQYMIERELAHGGFSSVYLARLLKDQTQVAIKEFLPRKQAHRTWNNVVVPNTKEDRILFNKGRALFFEEVKVLAQLKHKNIVKVINFFSANSTVYMVMNYDYGIGLNQIIANKEIPITEAFLVQVFKELLAGVSEIHANKMVHLDIKLGNILIRPEYSPLLLDFGAVQKVSELTKYQHSFVITKGFSPIEQYSHKYPMGSWTDIYAIGASMRSCLDRKPMQPSPERIKKDSTIPATKVYKRKFPAYLLEAIDWATEIHPTKRPQTTQDFINALTPV